MFDHCSTKHLYLYQTNQLYMSAASIKIILRKRANQDGTRPIVIQIIKNRKSSIVHTGHDVAEADWDAVNQKVKKSHPNSVRLNNYLLKKKSEVSNNSVELETANENVTAAEVKETIKPPAEKMFFAQAFSYLEGLRDAKKYNQYTANKPRIRHFKEFILNPKPVIKTAEQEKKERQENKKLTEEERNKIFEKFLLNKDIPFSTITPGLLEKFSNYLKACGDKGKRTIVNHLSVIRSVYSHADKNKVIDSKEITPFGKKGIKINFPPSKKEGLNEAELKRLEEVVLTDARFDHARNIWLFNYYFAGMRIADTFALRWSSISDGRLYYSMGKNDKDDSLKIPAKALLILEKYRPLKRSYDDFVFPDLKDSPYLNDEFYLERQINYLTSRYDKFLNKYVAPAAEIEKSLTMHIARHTFGNISKDRIPIQVLQKLYRHAHVQTTIGYQSNFIHKDVDDALSSVIG